jgi:N-methylhydantoinase B/oxoprolinase/acetone carboxylase alpha subunit
LADARRAILAAQEKAAEVGQPINRLWQIRAYGRRELVGLVTNQAHHVEMGGYAPNKMASEVTEIHQDGLQVTPLKLSRRRELNTDVLDLGMENE